MSNNVETYARKNQLLKLAKEKNKHMFLLKNPVEFVFRPEAWIENAERMIGKGGNDRDGHLFLLTPLMKGIIRGNSLLLTIE